MPSIEIDYSKALDKLDVRKRSPQQQPSEQDGAPQFIATPDGVALLEIQGTLNLPTKITTDHEMITIDDVHKLVKIGNLEIDGDRLTLFIGTSQRLLGVVEKIDPPFGLLKFPKLDGEENGGESNQKVEMVNIIDKRVVFKHRPLPIM